MIKMRPYVMPAAVRDSIDEDNSDDVDDDVFIKDARSTKQNEENGLKRPLMAPRRKNGRMLISTPIMKKHRRCWRCCEPFCYGLAALTVIIGLISLGALCLTLFPVPLQKLKDWWKNDPSAIRFEVTDKLSLQNSIEYVPCTEIRVQTIWTHVFSHMNSESPVRKSDLNGDNVKDIIFGYGVDDNVQYEGYTLPNCKTPNGDEVPCEGGVIAVNGATGEVLWQTWSIANVFSLICTAYIDHDEYPDCVAAGRLGLIFAINGRNGNIIWEFKEIQIETNSPIVMDLYTINVVRDLDDDGVFDIIAAHLEEREESKAGHIKLISGKNGKVLRTIPTPYKEEIFVPIQVITKEDGTELLLIVTGGQNTPGGIYSIRLLSLMQFTSEKEFTPLFQNKHSGFMVPAIVTDINGDNVDDLVISSFNSTVYAFDGHNFSIIWNFTFPSSESVSAIVPGHFNHDNITDFMVKYNTGQGFPIYYYSQTTVLDGVTGKPLLDSMITDSGGSMSLLGGISISQTFGGDFFLHWQTQCRNKEEFKDAYEFVPDSDIILQSRADTCRLRYNTSNVLKLYSLTRHIKPPGAVIFSTDDLEIHLNRTQKPQNKKFLSKSPLKHPKMLKKLLANREKLFKKISAAESRKKVAKLKHEQQNNEIRNQAFEQEVLQDILPNNELPSRTVYEQNKQNSYPYLLSDGYGGNSQLRDFQKDYDNERLPEEYEVLDENEVPEVVVQSEQQPIRLRTKYPGNRDVRSDLMAYNENELNETTKLIPTDRVSLNSLDKVEPLSLWDLEMEKEEHDAIKEANRYDYAGNNIEDNKRRERRKKMKRAETQKPKDAEEILQADDWYLASISSTGVLVKSKNDTKSSIDFAFVLNVRESETYPPLYLPQDLNCVEEKISAYKIDSADNLRILRKQFLKQCLSERLVNLTPHLSKYETQLIVIRIGISCTCHSLRKNEVCSELKNIERQSWTEYMGNMGNGYFSP